MDPDRERRIGSTLDLSKSRIHSSLLLSKGEQILDADHDFVARRAQSARIQVTWEEFKGIERSADVTEKRLPKLKQQLGNFTFVCTFDDRTSLKLQCQSMVPEESISVLRDSLNALITNSKLEITSRSAHEVARCMKMVLEAIPYGDLQEPSVVGGTRAAFLSAFTSHSISDGIVKDLRRGVPAIQLLTAPAQRWMENHSADLGAGTTVNGAKLTVGEVLVLTSVLNAQGISIEPVDFRGVHYLWNHLTETGVPLKQELVARWILRIAAEKRVDPFTPEGFKEVLPIITGRLMEKTPITHRGATLRGLLDMGYARSVSAAVLDVIENDPRFIAIKAVPLRAYDFADAPQNTWRDSKGEPTHHARELTEIYFGKIAERLSIKEWRRPRQFRKVMEGRKKVVTISEPITYWGTSYQSCFLQAYGESFGAAISDLVVSKDSFKKVAETDFRDFSLPGSARGAFVENGKPTALTRNFVRRIVTNVGTRFKVDPTSVDGFRVILRRISASDFQAEFNEWGRSGSGILSNIYENSPSKAVIDLVENDPDFSAVKAIGVDQFDFHRCAPGYWSKGPEGAPGRGSRLLSLRLFLKVGGKKREAHLRNKDVFLEVCREMLSPRVYSTPINEWGTTGKRMLHNGYRDSKASLLRDLVRKDSDFSFAQYWVEELLGGTIK